MLTNPPGGDCSHNPVCPTGAGTITSRLSLPILVGRPRRPDMAGDLAAGAKSKGNLEATTRSMPWGRIYRKARVSAATARLSQGSGGDRTVPSAVYRI